MTTTPRPQDVKAAEELRAALATAGLSAAMPHSVGPAQPLNVWRSSTDRYPADTVWIDHDGYTWGPNFEHAAPLATPLTELVHRIRTTVHPKEN